MDDISELREEKELSPKEKIENLVIMAQLAVNREKEIEDAENKLKVLKKNYQKLIESDIPALLARAGVETFGTKSGISIALVPVINISIPKKDKEKREFVIDYIKKNGGATLFKKTFEISMQASDIQQNDVLSGFLKDSNIDYSIEEGVHHSTLTAFFRAKQKSIEEQREQGTPVEEIPWDKLGGRHFQKAEIVWKGK